MNYYTKSTQSIRSHGIYYIFILNISQQCIYKFISQDPKITNLFYIHIGRYIIIQREKYIFSHSRCFASAGRSGPTIHGYRANTPTNRRHIYTTCTRTFCERDLGSMPFYLCMTPQRISFFIPLSTNLSQYTCRAHYSSKDRNDEQMIITIGLSANAGIRVGTLHVVLSNSFLLVPGEMGAMIRISDGARIEGHIGNSNTESVGEGNEGNGGNGGNGGSQSGNN